MLRGYRLLLRYVLVSRHRSYVASGPHLTEESEKEFLKVWFRAMVGDAQRNFHHDRVRLQSIIRDRNSPQKHVWLARIIVLIANGNGTSALTRAVGKGKTVVWR